MLIGSKFANQNLNEWSPFYEILNDGIPSLTRPLLCDWMLKIFKKVCLFDCLNSLHNGIGAKLSLNPVVGFLFYSSRASEISIALPYPQGGYSDGDTTGRSRTSSFSSSIAFPLPRKPLLDALTCIMTGTFLSHRWTTKTSIALLHALGGDSDGDTTEFFELIWLKWLGINFWLNGSVQFQLFSKRFGLNGLV